MDSAKVPDHEQASFGQAQHKAGLVTGYRFSREFSINPSFSLIGERFAYTEQGPETGTDSEGNPEYAHPLGKLPLTTLVNVNFRHTALFGQSGLDGSFAVQNLGNSRLDIAQPYQADYPVAPIPFAGRSYMIRMNYEL